jgi:cytochrome c
MKAKDRSCCCCLLRISVASRGAGIRRADPLVPEESPEFNVMSVVKMMTLAALTLVAVPAAAQTAGNPAKGKTLFLQCVACHSVNPGAPHKVGPNLSGIAGAKSASRPGYKYSKALTDSKIVWNDAKLNAFIAKPSGMVPGTKMVFGGIADPAKRADIVAYIKTLK